MQVTVKSKICGEGNWYESGKYDQVAVSAQGGIAARVFHSQVERGISRSDYFESVLEVGGASGQHLPYVKHDFDKWIISDITQASTDVVGSADPRVLFEVQDVHKLSYQSRTFDRVVATCLMHHLDDPLMALLEMRRVCKVGGLLSVLLPVDPGPLYEVAIQATSMRRARKLGFLGEARQARALGHRNHYGSLRWQFEEAFSSDQVTVHWWPFPVGGRFANAFSSWSVVKT